jgi:uncharacterized SAM-binding protein YcdF (DUF218 family)
MPDSPADSTARQILAFLGTTDALPRKPVDAIIGFGVFDLTLPRFCGELFRREVAPRIIFTGGIGAGTGDLCGPEAEVWAAELRRLYPDIPDTAVLLESRSTNTAENIRYTAELLERDHPGLAFGHGIRTAVIVASPSRLLRVQRTFAHLVPSVQTVRQLPPFHYETEAALYARNNVDYIAHLRGELDRLVDYPRRGWIAPTAIPPTIAAAHRALGA